MSSDYVPERALMIYAHPDDIDFGCSGTAAVWASKGADVRYIVITDGNIGSHDPNETSEGIAKVRRAEQTASAEHVGASVTFLGYPDGMLQPTIELRRDLVREIRRHRPNIVVCGDPRSWFPHATYINHPDHRAAAAAAVEACFPAPNSRLVFPELLEEGLEPCDINFVYISNPQDGANLWIDISETLHLKIGALKLHPSQMKDWDPTERMTQRAAEIGAQCGMKYAERYRKITLKELEPEADKAPTAKVDEVAK